MANTEIDNFLSKGAPAEQQAQPEQPTGETTAAPEAETPPPEPDEAATPADPQEGEANNFRALRGVVETTKKEREDWKVKATVAETQLAEVRRQLEEARRPPPEPQPQQQQPQAEIPNPATDPTGYHRYLMAENARAELNMRLNQSEIWARERLGDEAVDALIVDFKEAAKADPSLEQRLYRQPHPFAWAQKQLEILRAQAEIGDDPAAYRARLVAAERAKWEAEAAKLGEAQPRVSPAAGQAPSLAGVRSVAGRSSPAWTGPTPLEDIVRR